MLERGVVIWCMPPPIPWPVLMRLPDSVSTEALTPTLELLLLTEKVFLVGTMGPVFGAWLETPAHREILTNVPSLGMCECTRGV